MRVHSSHGAPLLSMVLAAACAGPVPSTGGPSAGPSGSPATLPTLAPPLVDVSGVPDRVHVEEAAAVASWIGPAGGRVSATAADGTRYELVIPEFALNEPTPIAMTPISEVDELGFSGGLAGAVYLQPAGLVLAVPATLVVETSQSAPAGTRLVGFDVSDDGASIDLVPAAGDEGEVSVAVHHFSAPGAAYGTPVDLATIRQAAIPSRLAGLLTILLADPVPWDLTTMGINATLIDLQWAGSIVHTQGPAVGLRQVIAAATADAELLRAVKDWRMFIFALNLYLHRGDAAAAIAEGDSYAGGVRDSHTVAYFDGQGQLGREFKDAIAGNEALCIASHDLRALANMWFWAGLGERYAPAEADWPAEAGGCAELVIAAANLPSSLSAGGSGSIDLQFAMAFQDGAQVAVDIEAALHGNGFTFGRTGGPDATAGVPAGTTLTEGVFGQQGPPYGLSIEACWYLDGIARNACETFQRPFGGGPSVAPTQRPTTTAGAAALAQEIAGTYSAQLLCGDRPYGEGTATATANGDAVSVTWSVATFLPPDLPGGLCGDAFRSGEFPTSGSYAGQVAEGSPGYIEIGLTDWQVSPCTIPDMPTQPVLYERAGRSMRVSVARCVSGLGTQTMIWLTRS